MFFSFVFGRLRSNYKHRRGGNNDCRRAIQAILRHSNGVALFKKDDQHFNYWRLSTAEDESQKPVPSPEAEKTPVRRSNNSLTPSNHTSNNLRSTRRNGSLSGRQTKETTSKSALAELNELQVLITCAIEEKGDSATANEINDYVVKAINDIRTDNKISKREPHKAIVTLLTKSPVSSSLFMRDPTNFIRWKCTESHPWVNCSIEEKEQKLNEISDYILTCKDLDFHKTIETEQQTQPTKEKIQTRR